VLAAREHGSQDQARQEEGDERDRDGDEVGAPVLDLGSVNESFIS